MHHAEVMAPAMESIIQVNGRPDAPARDITLRGLTLSITNTPLVAGGFGPALSRAPPPSTWPRTAGWRT
ncbi:MAG: hypothetical protein KA354_09730 [Phycisphaerae bacterium]|nr:hypothetical protein [Phycisphaerae bacterium]